MSDTSQAVPIGRVNWVKRDGANVLVNLMTMGRSLTFIFDAVTTNELIAGLAALAREQSDDMLAAVDPSGGGEQ